jgi:hypothetical protein
MIVVGVQHKTTGICSKKIVDIFDNAKQQD